MTTFLLDANLLIALLIPDHEHHRIARTWFTSLGPASSFATDPIVEGALIRFGMRSGIPQRILTAALETIHRDPRWTFWEDSLSYTHIDLSTTHGHRQVTDTYLAATALSNDGLVATLDRAFAYRCAHAVMLVPSE